MVLSGENYIRLDSSCWCVQVCYAP